jgi:hypothetical protein
MKQSKVWTEDLGAPSAFGHSLEDFEAEDW